VKSACVARCLWPPEPFEPATGSAVCPAPARQRTVLVRSHPADPRARAFRSFAPGPEPEREPSARTGTWRKPCSLLRYQAEQEGFPGHSDSAIRTGKPTHTHTFGPDRAPQPGTGNRTGNGNIKPADRQRWERALQTGTGNGNGHYCKPDRQPGTGIHPSMPDRCTHVVGSSAGYTA